jgi:hypothetical protein
MQINKVDNTVFTAKIVSSDSLDKALKLAQRDAARGGKEGKARASKFYNSLKALENDSRAKQLVVRTDSPRLYPHIKLDGAIRFLENLGEKQNNIAEAIQDAVNKLVESRFFGREIKDEAKYTNLKKAFEQWMK